MSNENVLQLEYDQFVNDQVSKVTVNGPSSLVELLELLPGIGPVEVVNSIRKLVTNGTLPSSGYNSIGIDTKQLISKTPDFSTDKRTVRTTVLPVPHPLDFDWRYTIDTAADLLNLAISSTKSGDNIVFLGTPTVLNVALNVDPKNRQLFLVDSNQEMIRAFSGRADVDCLMQYDLCNGGTPQVKGNVTIVDSPWYPEYIELFLRVAAKITAPGGTILLSLPPMATRPSITLERTSLFEICHDISLELMSINELGLRYETPFFEANSFRAAGISQALRDWRRGDLAIFRVLDRLQPFDVTSVSHELWSEVKIGNVRTRFKPSTSNSFADPRLRTLVEGDILPTVSRRELRRGYAQIWTSGNRIFGCAGLPILKEIYLAIASDTLPVESIEYTLGRNLDKLEVHLVSEATEQVLRVNSVEEAELELYEN